MHATNTITTLAQAEAYAASTKARYSNPLPSFATYKEGVKRALAAVEENYIRLCEEDRLLMEENSDD